MTAPAQPAPLPGKADPNALALRGRPGRVVRFRRGVILSGVVLAATAVLGVTWLGLRPAIHAANLGDAQPVDSRDAPRPPEALAGAPRTYGEVPRLGPPLPGDLGGPILEQQSETQAAGPSAGATSPAQEAGPAQDARARKIAEQQAARQSGVMMPRTPNAPDAPARPTGPDPASAIPAREPVALDPVRDPGAQQRKIDFVGVPAAAGDRNPFAIEDPPSAFLMSAGSVLSASLITGLNSDLPGLVTAQVTENAYDSPTGRILLVPQGARLIGSYDSVVAFGQKRALVVWQRIIFPDGASVRIENWPASDASGYAGLADKVDLHTWQLLKGVALSTLLGVGSALSFGDESDLVEALRQSTQQNAARAGDQLVSKNLNVQPTIRVRPGWPVRVVLHKDLVLRPWY